MKPYRELSRRARLYRNRDVLRIHAMNDTKAIASAFLKDDPARSAEHTPWRNESGKKLLRDIARS